MNLLDKMEDLRQKGIVIELLPINQVDNGLYTEEDIEKWNKPLIEYSCKAYDEWFWFLLEDINVDSPEVALREVVDTIYSDLDYYLSKVEEARENIKKR